MVLLCDIINKEPSTYEEAAEKKEWKDSMTEEYHSIMKNDGWEIVSIPEKKYAMTLNWIYKIKHVAYGSIAKYKEIFIARCFSYKEGIDYKETFAPVARDTSISTILALATVMKWKVHQMDVKTTFLNDVIEEEVHVEQPLGFENMTRRHLCAN